MAKTAITQEVLLKLRHSEKATNFEKNLQLVLTLLSKCQNKWEIFPNFVAFSQCLNFTKSLNFFSSKRSYGKKNQ